MDSIQNFFFKVLIVFPELKKFIMYKNEQDVSETFSLSGDVITLEDLDRLNWVVPVEDGLLLEGQDDTMDAAIKFNPQLHSEFIPTTPLGPPDRKIFSGDLKFEVEICGAHTNKSKYLYSHRLNRIYVDMGYNFSVQFKWDVTLQPYPDMYVRATTVFCEQAQAEKPVSRCIQHYHDTKNSGAEASEAMRLNVLHSARGAGAQDVFYCGVRGSPDCWLSVLVRLPQPTSHAYQFACKNSCSSGINRRTIAIIFTLEDFSGKVWGRQSVGARVCSCPKRDMRREEAEAPRSKRPLPPAQPAPLAPPSLNPKKIRLEVTDTDEPIQLPAITVVGRRVYNTGLTVMLNMMEEKRALNLRYHLPTEELDASIAQLKAHLDSKDPQT